MVVFLKNITVSQFSEITIGSINKYTRQRIIDFFEKAPNISSYSLGVNDGGGFCESDIKAIGEELNDLNFYNLSDVYFPWVEAVAKGVVESVDQIYANKLFGVLAYHHLAYPPTGNIHANIIPFITEDRLQWIRYNERVGDQNPGEQLNDAWLAKVNQTGGEIGWYDYLYGKTYKIPRIYFDQMADTIRYAHSKGIRYYYGEAYPNWGGEGPKLYIASKLLWNPNLDVGTLLDEWCTLAVGENAAASLKKYFDIWNKYWTDGIKNTAWFQQNGQILKFWDDRYMEGVTSDDIEQSRVHLADMVKNAIEDKHVIRAKFISDSFDYYEASFEAYGAGTN